MLPQYDTIQSQVWNGYFLQNQNYTTVFLSIFISSLKHKATILVFIFSH